MKFSDIPQLTRAANYRVNVDWQDLEVYLESWQEKTFCPLDIDPDFQRDHVWTEEQQIAYVEFKLRGGQGSDTILLNCPGWMNDFKGPFQLVDGKQRLQAVLDFLHNKIPAFGKYYHEYEGRIPSHIGFVFAVNDLKTRKDVLNWYLEINTGGTPHTEEEIEKVKNLLNQI